MKLKCLSIACNHALTSQLLIKCIAYYLLLAALLLFFHCVANQNLKVQYTSLLILRAPKYPFSLGILFALNVQTVQTEEHSQRYGLMRLGGQ